MGCGNGRLFVGKSECWLGSSVLACANCNLHRLRSKPASPASVCSCINTYGPEGRREPRAVAFAPGGRALLAAYPDGLRAFTLDPLQLCDTADGQQWGKVRGAEYASSTSWPGGQLGWS